MLNIEQLQMAVKTANQRFAAIRLKHLGMTAQLVFSSPAGQTSISSPPTQILDEFPAMIIDDASKTQALPLLDRSKAENLPATEKLRLNEELGKLGRRFHFDGECRVELRFQELNYDLIWKLQADELVDRNLTPQTKASIRIVLGRLDQLLPEVLP